MKIFVCDAFSSEIFKGNQAGVVIVEEKENCPSEILMKNIAAELKHSETAFVKKMDNKIFKIRYFTPTEEVKLCGHATISVFSTLRKLNIVSVGKYIAETLAGNLEIIVDKDFIWMDMASPKIGYIFNLNEITPKPYFFAMLHKNKSCKIPEINTPNDAACATVGK